MIEETFGPILPIARFDDVDEPSSGSTPSPSGSTPWTRDTDFGQAVAEQFDRGVVTINNHSFEHSPAAWRAPKTPVTVSNSFALYEMTRPRTIIVDCLKQREMGGTPTTKRSDR